MDQLGYLQTAEKLRALVEPPSILVGTEYLRALTEQPAYITAMETLQEPAYLKAFESLQESAYVKTMEAFRTPAFMDAINALAEPAAMKAIEAARLSIDTSGLAKAIDALSQPSYLKAVEAAQAAVSNVVDASAFTRLLESVTMPRLAWEAVLTDIQPAVDPGLYADTVEAFDAAAPSHAGSDAEASWIEELPTPRQLGLLLIVLQVLDAATGFAGDLTGEELPAAYYSGTHLLFALAGALLYCIGDSWSGSDS